MLATVLWLGWDGGSAGSWVAAELGDLLGAAAHVVPLALIVVGGLMLVRSALVDLRPFRTGLVLVALGLLLALGEDHGGALGGVLGGGLARSWAGQDPSSSGLALVLAGSLLVSGASAGALLRRSGGAVRRAGSAARRTLESVDWTDGERDIASERPTQQPGSTPRSTVPRRTRTS